MVKSLNTATAQIMTDPRQLTEPTAMFVSGDDQEAKDWVHHQLLERWFGWEQVIDLGDITAARGQEMWMALWLRLMGAARRRSTCGSWPRRSRCHIHGERVHGPQPTAGRRAPSA